METPLCAREIKSHKQRTAQASRQHNAAGQDRTGGRQKDTGRIISSSKTGGRLNLTSRKRGVRIRIRISVGGVYKPSCDWSKTWMGKRDTREMGAGSFIFFPWPVQSGTDLDEDNLVRRPSSSLHIP